MGLVPTLVVLLLTATGSFLFATLGYSLRDFSRAALGEWFQKHRKPGRLEAVVAHEEELALTASIARAAFNLGLILALMHLLNLLLPDAGGGWIYVLTFLGGFIIIGAVGVALPLVLAEHAAEPFIGFFSGLLRAKRILLLPLVKLHRPLDALARRATGHGPANDKEEAEEELEQEILEIVAEGRSEGVIDQAEHDMIQRVLRFQDVAAGQIMTARPDVMGIPVDADAEEVLRVIEETGYSRIPVYAGTLDKVVGVLYARDLFRYVGKRINGHTSENGQTKEFRLRRIMRQPLFVPETKPLADLLRDFQLQKVHIAIVLDEYGGTAGVVTIEDVLEELVGEIADEHEDDEAPMFQRLGEGAAEMDAKVEIGALNRLMGLGLPEDEGFTTVGGFVTTTTGTIPQTGTSFECDIGQGRRAVITVLDAEPQRVNRVRLETQGETAAPSEPQAIGADGREP